MSNPALTAEQKGVVTAISRHWWVLLFVGLVSLIVGVLMVAWPGVGAVIAAVLLAIYLIVSGLFSVVRAFASGLSGSKRALLIIGGGIGIILGLWMIRLGHSPSDPSLGREEQIAVLGLFLGIWFIFAAVYRFFGAAELKEGRGWAIFSGVVYLAGGVVLISVPLAAAAVIWVIGIWLIVLGIFEIINSFMVKGMAKKLSA
jgi:uncharacterized membrane protein HdeD (DUF308 family)